MWRAGFGTQSKAGAASQLLLAGLVLFAASQVLLLLRITTQPAYYSGTSTASSLAYLIDL
jgi:hypothetical protein